MFAELDAAGNDVMDRARGTVIFVSDTPSTSIGPLELDSDRSYLSTITMVAPSPDWFSGFYNFNVIDTNAGTWFDSFVVETFPWDAGSDAGLTYNSPNSPSNPQESTFQLTVDTVPSSGVFLSPDNTTVLPMATWNCSVMPTGTLAPVDSSAPSEVPTPSPIDLSEAPVDPTPAPADSTPPPIDP